MFLWPQSAFVQTWCICEDCRDKDRVFTTKEYNYETCEVETQLTCSNTCVMWNAMLKHIKLAESKLNYTKKGQRSNLGASVAFVIKSLSLYLSHQTSPNGNVTEQAYLQSSTKELRWQIFQTKPAAAQ